jgi:hypothetical protein
MIREHAFNSSWWGQPVGIVEDGAFFDLPELARRSLLAPFSWVEFRSRQRGAPSPEAVARSGFFHADTQIHFRLGLNRSPPAADCRTLEVSSAAEVPFEISPADFAPFTHERFLLVHGSSATRVNERYALWCNRLIAEHPETALRLSRSGHVQGWFVSRPHAQGLHLALAMLHRDARVSGFSVYAEALAAYRAGGHRVGFASFSVTNTAVMNVYSRLGALFLEPELCWLWMPR